MRIPSALRNLLGKYGKTFLGSREHGVPRELPRHTSRGIRVEKGDTLTIQNLTMSVHDYSEIEGVNHRTYQLRVPPWAQEFESGATFLLRRRLDARTYHVDKNRFDVVDDGWAVEISLKHASTDPVRSAHMLAERTLDLLAAEAFQTSELTDPLREHGVWFRDEGKLVLRGVTTARLAMRFRSSAVVRDPAGAVRPPAPRPPTAWHASHAYFRKSQSANDLHEAYRNLFLALECLLSEVYPWNPGVRESVWLSKALRHVVRGYDLDMSQFVTGSGGNPYRRFMAEQYRARRCALFHAKLSERPTVPGDVGSRDDLAAAMRLLGQLYVRLAGLITGAGFAGGGMTYTAFESMVESLGRCPMYVSEHPEFDLSRCVQRTGKFVPRPLGQGGVHHLRCTWPIVELPPVLRRAGYLVPKDDGLVDGMFTSLDVHTAGADAFELVVQHELTNAAQLRDWFL